MGTHESTPAGDGATSVSTGDMSGQAAEARWQPGAPLPRRIWLLAARRRYLINKRRQLRTAAILLAVAVIFVVLINIMLYLGRKQETAVLIAAAPELEQVLGKYDRNEVILSLLGSVVILAGVYFVTIIETHRTAGAEFNLIRQLGRVADGTYRVQLRLRRGDNLRDVEEPFNRMTRSLAQRAEEDATAMERLAAVLGDDQRPETAAAVAAELRKLAIAKRELLDQD
jgi:methyl-accepting chemotaxis protein